MRTSRNIRQIIPDIAFFAISLAFFSHSYKKLSTYTHQVSFINKSLPIMSRDLASITEERSLIQTSKDTIELDCQNPQVANVIKKGHNFFQIRISHCDKFAKIRGKNLNTGEVLLFLPSIDRSSFLSNLLNTHQKGETNLELILEEKSGKKTSLKTHRIFISTID